LLFINIYNNLCETRKQNIHLYKPFSGLHKHHIIPKHSGGTDDEWNFTYLTIREHKIAHFLLWKIHNNPNDLRSMKMLGANLSVNYRRTIGIYCRDNNIGIHSTKYDNKRKEVGHRVGLQAVTNKSGIHADDQELRSRWASNAGKASIISPNNPWSYWVTKEGQLERASMGGKAIKGMKWVTNGKHRTRIKPEFLEEYLSKGYRLGFTLD